MIVRWEQFRETFRHISAGSYGHYEAHSQKFDTYAEARAFAQGLKNNLSIRDIRIDY